MKKLAAIVCVIVGVSFIAVPAEAVVPPNVVIILTDDQRWDKVAPRWTPEVSEAFAGHFYSQAIVPNSLCCPSRTSILTGDYSHTTGVWTNQGTFGGFGAFDDSHTIAGDFDQAGYRTAMIGKYLNGYNPGATTYVPPGWDTWFALRTGDYYDYKAVSRSKSTTPVRTKSYGSRPELDYSTNVLRNEALAFISRGGPFFLYLSWTAPHGAAIPGPEDIDRFSGDTDYTDYGDPRSSSLESAYSADRATGKVLAALPANTIVVFTSDNGLLWGEHGLYGEKRQPYEEATRVPFAIKSSDGSWTPTASLDDIVSNVDLRPTLTRAAGVPMLTAADGIDLGSGSYAPRDEIVLEHGSPGLTYCGLRTRQWMYARYGDGRELLFDLTSDYAEETNLVENRPDKVAELKAEAIRLCYPTPPRYTWS